MLGELHALSERGLLDAFDIEMTRSLCRIGGVSDAEVMRAIALLSRSVRVGHSCLPLDRFADLTGQDDATQGSLFSPRASTVRAALEESALASDGERFAPLVLDDRDRLYFRRHWEYERSIALKLRERLTDPEHDASRLSAIAEEAMRLLPEPRSADQRRAVELIASRRLSVICGGPGTGKTTTVAAGLSALIKTSASTEPLRILVAAPTGKAAGRIAESIAKAKQTLPLEPDVTSAIPDEAQTLHRALRLRPYDATRRSVLEYNVVVVDEASMVDLELMSQLLDALPQKARLVLVGDADQLASVEAGCVLHDLVEASVKSPSTFVVELDTNFRFDEGSALGTLAASMRRGGASDVLEILEHDEHPSDAIAQATHRWRQALQRGPESDFGHRDAFTVLCPFRSGRLGTDAINRRVDAALRQDIKGIKPILIERNDHDLGVWNGDFGILREEHGTTGEAVIARPNAEPIHVAAERLPPFSLAYATTVHKAQGSEFDDVTLVLPDHDSPLLTRELLYTAVTRARRTATVVGQREVIRAALLRRATRFSGLVDAFAGR